MCRHYSGIAYRHMHITMFGMVQGVPRCSYAGQGRNQDARDLKHPPLIQPEHEHIHKAFMVASRCTFHVPESRSAFLPVLHLYSHGDMLQGVTFLTCGVFERLCRATPT